ncbi:MAG: biotin-dependent carboxyltransferase family protein [Chitinophagaceae bacterium]|nr:biotin-dependent carboxyltransferase family protein [Chitinophagaceae bacterium]
MSISIIKSKPGCTIQDEGRFGFQALGINPTGAMDLHAMHIANALLGNALSEAVIEFIFPAPVFYFHRNTFISLSGADFGATINNTSIPINRPIFIPAETTLHFTKKIHGNFAYLAVQSGFELHDWLGSYSTHKKVGAGGLHGDDLQKGDIIHFRNEQKNYVHEDVMVMPWQADVGDFYNSTIYCTAAPESIISDNESTHWWKDQYFTILPNSDRMGYRLSGGNFEKVDTAEITSSAVTRGTIQLPPNKVPIVLMADHQTTGGYARIATICASSFASFAQQVFNASFIMEMIAIKEAEKKWIEQYYHLQILQQACTLRIKEQFHAY